ncbi:hypothetical protein GGI35DRAFT_465196 [Trichoderma velutinum]
MSAPTSKETTETYEMEFMVLLRPEYEWRESERDSSTVILKGLNNNKLVFRVSIGPTSTSIPAEFNIHTN